MVYKLSNSLKKLYWAVVAFFYSRIVLHERYFLCARGIGDTVIFFSLLNKYCLNNGCEKVNIIVSENQNEIANAYSRYIGERIVISKSLLNGLISLSNRRLLPKQIHYILPDSAYDMLGYHNLSITDMIQVSLELPDDKPQLELPQFDECSSNVKSVIEKYSLKKDKTVIIARDAVSVSLVSDSIWEDIATFYLNQNYSVVTNLSSMRQKPIENTIGLALPLDEIFQLAEYGGWFVGLRSGLCDLLALSSCRMTVLYPTSKDMSKYTFLNMSINKKIDEIYVSDTSVYIKESSKECNSNQ